MGKLVCGENKKPHASLFRKTKKVLTVCQWIISLYTCLLILQTFIQVSSLGLLFLIKNLFAFTIGLT